MLELMEPSSLLAVFPSQEQAEAAVADLLLLGLGEDEVGVAIVDMEPGWYRLLNEAGRDELAGMLRGIQVGVPSGALAGIALAAFVIPGIGAVIGGGGLALASAGAFWGGLGGAWYGMLRKVHWNDNEDRWVEEPARRGDVLVVTKPGEHYDAVHGMLLGHGARFFVDPDQPEHDLPSETDAI